MARSRPQDTHRRRSIVPRRIPRTATGKPGLGGGGRRFVALGFTIKATTGTKEFLARHGIQSERVYKMREKRPKIADEIMDGEIQLVINTLQSYHASIR